LLYIVSPCKLMEMRMKRIFLNIIAISFLVKHWPPALQAWSTKSVRDMFYISPKFPRLIDSNSLKRTISDGVTRGIFGYGCKSNGGMPTLFSMKHCKHKKWKFQMKYILFYNRLQILLRKELMCLNP
jgi:hypothetical protein